MQHCMAEVLRDNVQCICILRWLTPRMPAHQCSMHNNDVALHAYRFEAWIPMVGAIVTLIVFLALPTYFYIHKYPYLNNCGADVSRYY